MKFLLVFTFVFLNFVSGASFNCTKASTKVEKMICADAQLSQLDSDMGSTYKKVSQTLEEKNLLLSTQRIWLKERETCDTSDCILESTKERMIEIESFMNKDEFQSSGSAELREEENTSYDDSEAPVEIAIETTYNQAWKFYYPKVVISSIIDNLVITDVKINNGNCKFADFEFTGINAAGGLNSKKLLPKKLNSYQDLEVNVNKDCRVKKIDISTNKGSWSVKR